MARIERTGLLTCLFGAKTQEQVHRLFVGPGAYICGECVRLCCGILDDESAGTGRAAAEPAGSVIF